MNDEGIRVLAEAHWRYTKGILEIALPDPVPKEVAINLSSYFYVEAWLHGVKHDREEPKDVK